MPELKDRIPVLNDIVHRVAAEHSGPGSGSSAGTDPVLSAETIDVLVDTLHREFLDRVTRSLHEAIAREEAGLRSAIRAHLEVTLPEVIARHGDEAPDGGCQARPPSRTSTVLGAEHREQHEPMESAKPVPSRSQRRKLRLPRKRKGSVKASA
jgi:hypothetical protein